MARAQDQGFWKGFVYGIVTPVALGLVVTVIGTIVVIVGGRRELRD